MVRDDKTGTRRELVERVAEAIQRVAEELGYQSVSRETLALVLTRYCQKFPRTPATPSFTSQDERLEYETLRRDVEGPIGLYRPPQAERILGAGPKLSFGTIHNGDPWLDRLLEDDHGDEGGRGRTMKESSLRYDQPTGGTSDQPGSVQGAETPTQSSQQMALPQAPMRETQPSEPLDGGREKKHEQQAVPEGVVDFKARAAQMRQKAAEARVDTKPAPAWWEHAPKQAPESSREGGAGEFKKNSERHRKEINERVLRDLKRDGRGKNKK